MYVYLIDQIIYFKFLVPSTYECNYQKCEFLLRIFAETAVEGR